MFSIFKLLYMMKNYMTYLKAGCFSVMPKIKAPAIVIKTGAAYLLL
jgi:hypothetical protein